MAGKGEPDASEARRLAAMSRQATDLSGGPLAGEVAERIRERAEAQLGLRCGGCGVRIGIGFLFHRIDVVVEAGQPTVDVMKLSACNGVNGCEFAKTASEGADVMEAVEYAWLDGAPDPAAPADGEQHCDCCDRDLPVTAENRGEWAEVRGKMHCPECVAREKLRRRAGSTNGASSG